MEHQGMLLFLSSIRVENNGEILPKIYKNGIGPCYTTNESAVRYGVQKHGPMKRLFVFATQTVQLPLTYKTKEDIIKEYRDEEDHTYTHLSYFEHRLQQGEHPIETELEVADYDENADMTENIQSIVEMAAKVDAFIASLPKDDTLVLHADCTGGMRNAAMIMMAVLRLMQYGDRVRIGDILYSNLSKRIVEEGNDIYALFDLIAGAEEFVRFGSVQTLRDYYKRQSMSKQSPELQQLIKAMADFSDAISLCNSGTFRDAIKNLRDAMKAFRTKYDESGDTSLPDSLMNRLYERISHEYEELLQSEAENKELEDITLIKWCIQHDYVQQALTLYTEQVPEIFSNCRIASLTPEGRIHFKKDLEANDRTSEAFKLFAKLKDQDRESKAQQYTNNVKKKYYKLLRKEVNMIPSAVKDDPNKDWATQAQEIIEDYLNKHSHTEFIDTAVLNDAEGLTASLSIVQSLALLRIPNLVVDEKIKLSKPQEDKFKALKAVYESDQETQSLQGKEPREQAGCLIKFLNGRMNQTEFPKLCSDITIFPRYSDRFIHLWKMNWVHSNIPEDTLRLLLDQYGRIKDQRNHTNHARNDHQLNALGDIKALLNESLETINEVCFPLHIKASKSETENPEENGTA